jgi:hypothetical protein
VRLASLPEDGVPAAFVRRSRGEAGDSIRVEQAVVDSCLGLYVPYSVDHYQNSHGAEFRGTGDTWGLYPAATPLGPEPVAIYTAPRAARNDSPPLDGSAWVLTGAHARCARPGTALGLVAASCAGVDDDGPTPGLRAPSDACSDHTDLQFSGTVRAWVGRDSCSSMWVGCVWLSFACSCRDCHHCSFAVP